MSYRVEILRAARQALRRVQRGDAERIQTAIEALADDPRPSGCTKLTGREAWRIRVGSYRVIYEIHDGRLVIAVVAIGHRREIYRRQ